MTAKGKIFLIAGLGSVGRRHLRNLLSLGYVREDIILYRTGQGTLSDDELAGFEVFHDLDEALKRRPAAVVISNPTSLHIPTAIASAKIGCNLFIEKPLSHNMEGIEELEYEVKRQHLSVLAGFMFRFHPGFCKIKKWLQEQAIGNLLWVQAHWGEFLPDWHPWEDYKISYSARPGLGGGVVLTLCHPYDYLRWFCGNVESVSAVTSNSGLGMDVEDTAEAILRFKSGVTGNVHINYIERPAEHYLRIIGQKGVIKWDNRDGAAHLYQAETDKWTKYEVPQGFERNTMFVDEMRHFTECLNGRDTPVCTLEDGVAALRIAIAVKLSAQQRREISV
ncbi:MAG: Gfo/Idh/MocA family oxidoreductase [Sedimentisphaerales bacterium]